MAEQRLMKDGLGTDAIERIARALALTVHGFPADQFRHDALSGIDELELKQRVSHLIEVLHQYLPDTFNEAVESLMRMKPVWDHGGEGDPLSGFAAWPIIDYIGVYGLDHPEVSLHALKHLTSLFSAEFAIRPFLVRYPDMTLQHLDQWCRDPDKHVRRLVSEGTRPRLPWGQRLPRFIADPAPVCSLLAKLKDDESEYVRRSVANNLNDISKDHPDLVIRICGDWLDESSKKAPDKKRAWLIRHATRTLVKRGHPKVFALLGYTEFPQLSVQKLELDDRHIQLGETANIAVSIKSTSAEQQHLIVDYAVHQVKANGQRNAKVFKLKTLTIKPGETIELQKSHAFKKITTRQYYSGRHSIELLINGVAFGCVDFELSVP